MTQWEIQYIQDTANSIASITEQANRLGALGWEPIGIASADRTLGVNAMVLVMKRAISHPPDPPATKDEWQRDPTGRHELRRWTWRGWGAECISGKARVVDPPNMHPDPPVSSR